jgi:hypothetical protein
MTLTEDYESSAGVEGVDIGRRIDIDDVSRGDTGWRSRGRGRMGGLSRLRGMDIGSDARGVVSRGLAMSGACLAALIGTSMLHSRSAWAGINSLHEGLPFVGRRVRSEFSPRLAAIGIGTVIGGSLLMSLIHQPIARTRIGRSRIGTGLIASVGSFAMDRFVMQRALVPSLRNSLGPVGMILKYGAIGLAAALGRRV